MKFNTIKKFTDKLPPNKKTFSTVESIKSISNTKENLDYVLQRKATEFKKSGRIDLAIACLEKSNEIMLMHPNRYVKKDFMRLVEYLKLDKQFDKAREVEADLKERLPKLFSGEQLESEQLKQVCTDLVSVSGNSACPYCSIYMHRIYSKSGENKKFPSFSVFPDNLKTVKCPECECYIGFSSYTEFDYNGSLRERIAESNRPFTDMRTDEQKAYYETEKNKKLQQEKDKQDYDWICEHLPETAPKSLSGYRRMKGTQSKNYTKIVEEAQKKGYSI